MPLALHGTLLLESEAQLETRHGPFRAHRFRNLRGGAPALALVRGDPRGEAELLARVHSSCVTSEALGACDCDCAEQLDAALERLAAEGRGVLFYLLQEGRGAGFAAKARDRMWVQASRERLTTFEAYEEMGLGADRRRYDQVAFQRALLGIEAPLALLTSNPEKAAALAADEVPVARALPLGRAPSPWNHHYLASKQRSGHVLRAGAAPARSALPEGAHVVRIEPAPVDPEGRFVLVAAYLLPVRLPDEAHPVWLRLHLVFDLGAGCERIVLALEGGGAGPVPVRVHRERLLDRFPAPGGSASLRTWWGTVRAFRGAGGGAALLVPEDEAPPDDAALAVLAGLVPGEAAFPLTADPDEDAGPLAAALTRAGLRLGAPRSLDSCPA